MGGRSRRTEMSDNRTNQALNQSDRLREPLGSAGQKSFQDGFHVPRSTTATASRTRRKPPLLLPLETGLSRALGYRRWVHAMSKWIAIRVDRMSRHDTYSPQTRFHGIWHQFSRQRAHSLWFIADISRWSPAVGDCRDGRTFRIRSSPPTSQPVSAIGSMHSPTNIVTSWPIPNFSPVCLRHRSIECRSLDCLARSRRRAGMASGSKRGFTTAMCGVTMPSMADTASENTEKTALSKVCASTR
jgi:hypothetical protein